MAENGALCSYARWYRILLKGFENELECFEGLKGLKGGSQCIRSVLSFYVKSYSVERPKAVARLNVNGRDS